MIELADDVVESWARGALGDPTADVGGWSIERTDYDVTSPSTGGLWRIRGTGWSVFAKLVQSFRHWPLFDVFPPDLRARLATESAWRYEADLYASRMHRVLPAGMRLPAVHGVLELGDDRLLLVMGDIATDGSPWDTARFTRAARLLGRLNVRLTRATGLPSLVLTEPSEITRAFYTSRLLPVALPALADDATWAHPLLAAAVDGDRTLRADLAELAMRIPALLDVLSQLPQLRAHGDASPVNLLVPAGRPDDFIVIDWAFGTMAAVGDDLGQLLVGHAHDGVLGVAELSALHGVLVRAYGQGLLAEGFAVSNDVVRFGMDVGLVVRSAFTALPLERLTEPATDELAELVRQRIELTRYLVDVGLDLPPAPAESLTLASQLAS